MNIRLFFFSIVTHEYIKILSFSSSLFLTTCIVLSFRHVFLTYELEELASSDDDRSDSNLYIFYVAWTHDPCLYKLE